MKLSVQNLSFKSNFIDDDVSKREYIRHHIYENLGLCESNLSGRMSEWELNQYLKSLVLAPVELKNAKMKKVNSENLRPIPSTNSLRGGLYDIDKSDLKILKDLGIKRIVELREKPYLENMCKDMDLEYVWFSTKGNFWGNSVFLTVDDYKFEYPWICGKENISFEEYFKRGEDKKRDFIENFINFIQTMQKDDVFIGCECGVYSTNIALLLNHFFNPKASCTPTCIDGIHKDELPRLKNLYNSLTFQDKIRLGWDEEFDRNFLSNLEKYLC